MLFKDVSSAPCWTHAIPMPARSHQRTQLRTVVCSVSHLRWCTWGRTNPWRTGADNNVQLNVHQTNKADCRLRLEAAEIHRRPPLAGYMWKGSTSDTLRTTSRRVWHGPLTSTPWQRSVFTTWDVWGTSDSRSFYASMVERLLKGSILTWMVSSSSPPTLTLPTLLPSRRCYGCVHQTYTKLLQIHHLYLFVFIFIQTVFIFLQQVHNPFDCPLCHVWQLKTIWIWMYNRIFRSWGRRNRKSNAFRQMAEESKGPRLASSGDDHRKLQGHWSNG